eukprot:TRINITY_DN4679_c0_g1_i1.p1 TRINITY_DN4679_c0_g1~~TRINITY_DN4679_c0_g1_i1.p1  ORF type:complete len:229 (+),score=-0.46 TRINITY_DN4679_c0_g1_i1:277-963(+)
MGGQTNSSQNTKLTTEFSKSNTSSQKLYAIVDSQSSILKEREIQGNFEYIVENGKFLQNSNNHLSAHGRLRETILWITAQVGAQPSGWLSNKIPQREISPTTMCWLTKYLTNFQKRLTNPVNALCLIKSIQGKPIILCMQYKHQSPQKLHRTMQETGKIVRTLRYIQYTVAIKIYKPNPDPSKNLLGYQYQNFLMEMLTEAKILFSKQNQNYCTTNITSTFKYCTPYN